MQHTTKRRVTLESRRLEARFALASIVLAICLAMPVTGAGASQGQRVYVSETLGGRVVSISMDGQITPLATGLDSPRALALRGQTLYVNVADGVVAVPTSGGTPTSVFKLSEPFGIAVSGDDIYVTDDSGQLTAYSISRNKSKVLVSGLSLPRGVTVAGNMVYVSETGAGRVLAIPRSGGIPRIVVDGLAGPTGLSVVDDTLFVAEVATGRLLSISLTGGTVTPLAAGFDGPRSLAATGGILYVAEFGAGRVAALPLTSGSAVAIAEGLSGPVGVAVP